MNFTYLCNTLDQIKATTTHVEKKKLAKTFFQDCRQWPDLFTVLRLCVPKLDRDRPSFRMKESKISKLLIRMLGLPPGNDKNLLLSCVKGSTIDFGDVIYSVLSKYIVSKEIGMTVDDINSNLDKIANRTNDSSLDDLILQIFRKLSARNIRWLIHIILKDLKLGLSDNSILNCFHEDALSFYNSNNNLKRLCEVLKNPEIKLHEIDLAIFEAFRPMLSKRCDSGNFKKCFPETKSFFIENKFDGERFQLHMDDGNFKFFSRNGFDYTSTFGASYNDGIFTKLLKNVFDSNTKRVILDGEMMLWNKSTKNFGSKGMNLDVKKLTGNYKYQPCFCVFDVLLHNDRVLTGQALHKRLQILSKIIKNQIPGTVIISHHIEGDINDIITSLNASMDNNEEGIIVKDPKSIYKFGERNSGWFKIKMEYFDDVVHDLDVIVMGGFYGANKKITSLMTGICSGSNTFFSFGSISSGLNTEQLDILNEKFKSHGVGFEQFAARTKGKLLFGRETPDVYLEPENSYVLQIRATELIRSTSDQVKCPYTLRFPRVLKFREDKLVNDCVSMNEILELVGQNTAVVKLSKRHIELTEIGTKAKAVKKRKLEMVNIEKREEGDFLNNKKFYVDSGTEKWGKEEIYYSIKKAGGEVCYRLEANLDVVLFAKISNKLSNLLKQNHRFDIVHVDWLKRVLETRQLIDYKQNEILYLGSNFSRDVSTNCDRFGDSVDATTTPKSLKLVFQRMSDCDFFLNTNNAVNFNTKLYLLQRYVAYFDRFQEINNPKSNKIFYSFPDEMDFLYYRGKVAEEICPDVNLIVMKDEDAARKEMICIFLENNNLPAIEIVTRSFIKNLLKNGV